MNQDILLSLFPPFFGQLGFSIFEVTFKTHRINYRCVQQSYDYFEISQSFSFCRIKPQKMFVECVSGGFLVVKEAAAKFECVWNTVSVGRLSKRVSRHPEQSLFLVHSRPIKCSANNIWLLSKFGRCFHLRILSPFSFEPANFVSLAFAFLVSNSLSCIRVEFWITFPKRIFGVIHRKKGVASLPTFVPGASSFPPSPPSPLPPPRRA